MYNIIFHLRSLLCEWRFLAKNPRKQIVYRLTNISVDCGDTLQAYTNGECNFQLLEENMKGLRRVFGGIYFMLVRLIYFNLR